jgi:hypothetical protein
MVDFRRAVTLPDGTKDEAVVTLAILPDHDHPNLSVFLCHQHRPEFVWNKDWLVHRNTAEAITGVTWFSPQPAAHAERFRQIWGNVRDVPNGIMSKTGGGDALMLDEPGFAARFPGMALPDAARARHPCGVAISVRVRDYAKAEGFVRRACPQAILHEGRALIPASFAGGIVLEIKAS